MDLPVLDPQEQRVLGALMEKELTVPASYPLTLNSLRLACNQSTSRDPVVDYSENELVEVTPAAIRVRKTVLSYELRKKSEKVAAAAE